MPTSGLDKYLKTNNPIVFDKKKEGGVFIAVSNNFKYGSIITSAHSQEDLDLNIEDAVLTAFDMPVTHKKIIKNK